MHAIDAAKLIVSNESGHCCVVHAFGRKGFIMCMRLRVQACLSHC